jgi:L-arabinokinase
MCTEAPAGLKTGRSVVFYISGHGFGHASRQVEVMRALHARMPAVGLVIRSAVDPHLLSRTLTEPYDLRAGPCDAGIVQRSSVEHDHDATARAAIDFYTPWRERIDDELGRLADLEVALIAGDIPPLAFEVAAALGVPSVAIANFTWDWIYADEPALAGEAWLIDGIAAAYRQATVALELPFSGGFDVFPARRPLPLIARQPTRSRAETRTALGIPPDRPAALLSFGGYGMPALDLNGVDAAHDWTLVTTDRVTPGGPPLGPHVIRIDERAFRSTGFRYEDLVAAADVVVTKPGYGIIAECITSGTAMLYTSRGHFREYDVLVAALPRYVRSRFISQADLFAGRWRTALDALLAQAAPPETMATDGAAQAAAEIVTALSSGAV